VLYGHKLASSDVAGKLAAKLLLTRNNYLEASSVFSALSPSRSSVTQWRTGRAPIRTNSGIIGKSLEVLPNNSA
jgi:hypothetical protein